MGFEPGSPGYEADAELIELESLYMLFGLKYWLTFAYMLLLLF